MKPATLLALALASLCTPVIAQDAAPAKKPLTMADVIAASQASDWRALDPENTLYLELASGRVVIELAPAFAPLHAENVRTLVREGYFDGLPIIRSHDNFVVQWGDPGEEGKRREMKKGKARLAPEYTRVTGADLAFTRLPDRDGYAPEVGFSNGLPAARDPAAKQAWLAHCYGMVGAGRGNEDDSGSGAEIYVVTGHSPRQLDRNIALFGRVVQGMEQLSALPRGTGPLGFYEKPEQFVPIKKVTVAADVPAVDRTPLEVMRTDTPIWTALVESRRNRKDDWYKVPAGHIELCNVPIPVRAPAPMK